MINIKAKFWGFLIFIFDLVFSALGYFLCGIVFKSEEILSGKANLYYFIFAALVVFFFFLYDLYKVKTDKVFNAAVSTTLSVIFAAVCVILAESVFSWQKLPIRVLAASMGFMYVLLLCWRTVTAFLVKNFGPKKKCLILENMNTTSRLARKLKYSSNTGRETTYYMIDETNKEEVDAILNEKIAEYDLIFISPAISSDLAQKIMSKAFILDKEVGVLADLDSVSTFHGVIYQIDDTPVIEKHGMRINSLQRFVKRAFDILFALLMCAICSPLFIVCAILIKIDSKGPVFYKQKRYTIHKKIFEVYKFRTMVNDAEKNGAQFAAENDPRITRVGRVLRALRLDELPQLFNILSGSMSVVGPRPERPVFADEFSKNVKNYDMRFSVKAGLTGYAQIYGKYNTRVSDKILMDIIYIVNYSVLLDIKIILLTGKTMFVKSATEGFDEEKDTEMLSDEKEKARREETLQSFGGDKK